jgi:hypothetical protein
MSQKVYRKFANSENDQNIRRLEQLLANISGASDQFPQADQECRRGSCRYS